MKLRIWKFVESAWIQVELFTLRLATASDQLVIYTKVAFRAGWNSRTISNSAKFVVLTLRKKR
jgi:hypothetical protein